MKIAFNGVGCGWGNNGGTQSVFRMAMALARRGHTVEIWSDSPNQCTWFPLEGVTYRILKLDDAPMVDVLIAGGCGTVKDTYKYPRKGIGVNWVRAIETWCVGERSLFKQYKYRMPLWVNSEWMRDRIQKVIKRPNIPVIYPGLPLDDFYRVKGTKTNGGFTIGCLYSTKPRKQWQVFMKLRVKLISNSDIRYVGFGAEGDPGVGLDEYLQCPSMEDKRALYSQCDLWFAPTNNEGLHIPPMEAALCGAVVIGNAEPSAGMVDHLEDGQTGYTFRNVEDACRLVKHCYDNRPLLKGLNAAHREVIRTKIGSIETNAKRLERQLETELGIPK